MNRIRILPEQVANQIAAGEVVERPASVVKELIENSLDAQATHIRVEIQAGGRSLIRVTDNGIGMSRDDALLCLERHATSKISSAEDLNSIRTMGFRGEALPSIASVSKFTLTTRERDSSDPEATQVIVNGGKIVSVKAAGAPYGTCVEVRQLFFNLPARRKFLKSPQTEEAHIHHYIILAAIANPHVAFEYIRDGYLVWQLPVVKSTNKLDALSERLRSLKLWEEDFIPVNSSAILKEDFSEIISEDTETPIIENVNVTLYGFIGSPGISRATRDDQRFFVNSRPVESKAINYALLEGYHTSLMKGRYPVCVLFLEIDPAAVDVNIHPTKREIKFRNERLVRRFITETIREYLTSLNNLNNPSEEQTISSPAEAIRRIMEKGNNPPVQLPLSDSVEKTDISVSTQPLFVKKPVELSVPPDKQLSPITEKKPLFESNDHERELIERVNNTKSVPLLQVPLRYLGVIGKLYVVMESDCGIVLLDQHAAHERILFEQMLERINQQEVTSQRLLLPEAIELGVKDADFLRKHLPMLNKLGIGISEFGERTFLLDSLPLFLKLSHPKVFILNLIDELKKQTDDMNLSRLGEEVIARAVCRQAVKANDPLSETEILQLVESLKRCKMPYTCPHGRPTIIEINYRELAKKFGRIV